MPLFLMALIMSTIFDSATIPFMGFTYFIIGYPKPQRGWSAISSVQPDPNDSRSDGQLYKAMIKQLERQLQ